MSNMLISARIGLAAALVAGLAGCDSATKVPIDGEATAATAKAPAGQDWTRTIVQTPESGFRMGNPDASVKLVEFASFTCVHCKDFHLEAEKALKPGDVRAGRVSYEYRPFMLNPYDFAAVLLATCEGPARFFVWANELYQNHDAWITPFTKLTEADVAPLRNLPPGEQIKGLAVAGGLHEFARTRGMPRAKFDQCMTNQANLDRQMAAQQAATDRYRIAGTPTFLLNGEKVEGVTRWSALQPKIADAL